jgi:hypothetical protein
MRIGISAFFLLFMFYAVVLHKECSGSNGPGFGNQAVSKNLWSVFGNPAGVTSIQGFEAGSFYRRGMFLNELSTKGFVLGAPILRNSSLAFGFQNYGYSLYNESTFKLAFAKRFGEVIHAGISFDYHHHTLGSDYGSSSYISASAGFNLRISRQISSGIYIKNPVNLVSLNGFNQAMATDINVGVQWSPGDHFSLGFGISKIRSNKEILLMDVIYKPFKKFALTLGVTSGYSPVHFGYSVLIRSCRVGVLSGYHFQTGFTPQIAFSYKRK